MNHCELVGFSVSLGILLKLRFVSHSTRIVLIVLKVYTGFSNRQLVERLNGNIHC